MHLITKSLYKSYSIDLLSYKTCEFYLGMTLPFITPFYGSPYLCSQKMPLSLLEETTAWFVLSRPLKGRSL